MEIINYGDTYGDISPMFDNEICPEYGGGCTNSPGCSGFESSCPFSVCFCLDLCFSVCFSLI